MIKYGKIVASDLKVNKNGLSGINSIFSKVRCQNACLNQNYNLPVMSNKKKWWQKLPAVNWRTDFAERQVPAYMDGDSWEKPYQSEFARCSSGAPATPETEVRLGYDNVVSLWHR